MKSLISLFLNFKRPEQTQEDSPMLLFVGLGNPGTQYENNRHNVGFMAVDAIAEHVGGVSFRSKFQGQYAEVIIDGQKVGILKPETFMNESGQSVGKAAKFYKLNPEQIVVFHDELDLEPGKVRLKDGGGHAGHNGLRSIEAHLGTKEYKRVRLGIGHPGDKKRVKTYVLNDFAKAEQPIFDTLTGAVAKNINYIVKGNESDFMSKVAAEVNIVRGETK